MPAGVTGIPTGAANRSLIGETMIRPAPPRRTLTAARLDRVADLDRDLAAVASALHHGAGLLVDAAITRARESFRAGETVRDWWERAQGHEVSDAVPDQEARPRRHRRLSDYVLIAFHFACDQGDLEVAQQLIVILEHMLRRPPPQGRPERRTNSQTLVAAHERLWTLRHPEPRDD
jgi:hypothetical protein